MNDIEEIQAEEKFPNYRFPGRPPPCSQGSNVSVREFRYYISIYVCINLARGIATVCDCSM